MLGLGTLVVFGSLGLARFGYTAILPSMQEGLGLTNVQAGGVALLGAINAATLPADRTGRIPRPS